MKKYYVTVAIVALVLLAGFFIPLGSYTTTKGCPDRSLPTKRLHFILGDSLEEIEDSDVEPPPNVGCSINIKYVLYFF